MSMRYKGGVISATAPTTSTSAATGVWTLTQQMQAQGAGTWPSQPAYWIGLLGDANIEYGQQVKVDSSGNVYLVGWGGTPYQWFLAKYSSSGAIQWQKGLSITNNLYAYALDLDSSNNIYIVGSYAGSAPLLAKYNSSGTLQWQRRLYGISPELATGRGIAVDSSGNSYITGWYNDSIGFAFVQLAKYDTFGAIQWQRKFGTAGVGNEYGYGIAVDSSGNSYITGITGLNILIIKYNTSGTLQWQRSLAGSSNCFGYGVAVDSSGNSYIVGTFNSSSAVYGFELAKYDTSGTLQWQRRLSGSPSPTGLGIALDSSSNVYAVGYNGTYLNIAKYNSSGTIQWQRTLSNSGGSGIASDLLGNVYVIGTTSASGTSRFIFAKLPGDGSLTGTYTVGGYSFTYAASTLTDAATTLFDSATSFSSVTSTLIDVATSYTDAATTLTSSVTTIP